MMSKMVTEHAIELALIIRITSLPSAGKAIRYARGVQSIL
jgi:hypothetical protein